jgi:hypothetical protein
VKRFGQLGGLQLDRDIRALVAYAGELTQRPVRDKFAELTQVGVVAPELGFASGMHSFERPCEPTTRGNHCA